MVPRSSPTSKEQTGKCIPPISKRGRSAPVSRGGRSSGREEPSATKQQSVAGPQISNRVSSPVTSQVKGGAGTVSSGSSAVSTPVAKEFKGGTVSTASSPVKRHAIGKGSGRGVTSTSLLAEAKKVAAGLRVQKVSAETLEEQLKQVKSSSDLIEDSLKMVKSLRESPYRSFVFK